MNNFAATERQLKLRFCIPRDEPFIPFGSLTNLPLLDPGLDPSTIDEMGGLRFEYTECNDGPPEHHPEDAKPASLYLFKSRVVVVLDDGATASLLFSDLARFTKRRSVAFKTFSFATPPVNTTLLAAQQRGSPNITQVFLAPQSIGQVLSSVIDFLWKLHRGKLSTRTSVYLACGKLQDVLGVAALPEVSFPCTTTASTGREEDDEAGSLESLRGEEICGSLELLLDDKARLRFMVAVKELRSFNTRYERRMEIKRSNTSESNRDMQRRSQSLGKASFGSYYNTKTQEKAEKKSTTFVSPVPLEVKGAIQHEVKRQKRLRRERRLRRQVQRLKREDEKRLHELHMGSDEEEEEEELQTQQPAAEQDHAVFLIDLDNVLMISTERSIIGKNQLTILCREAGTRHDSHTMVSPRSNDSSSSEEEHPRPRRYVFSNIRELDKAEHWLRKVWTVNCNSLVTLSLIEMSEREDRLRRKAAWLPKRISVMRAIPDSECFDIAEVEGLLTSFQLADANQDCFITRNEFVASLGPAFHIDVVEGIYRVFDTNGDNRISFPEYLFGIRVLQLGNHEDRLSFQHRLFDIYDQGYFTLEGLTRILNLFYRLSENFARSRQKSCDCKHLFSLLDKRKKGKVTLADFKDAMSSQAEVQKAFVWSMHSEQLRRDMKRLFGKTDQLGRTVVFGSPSWLRVTCILTGIEQSIMFRKKLLSKDTQVANLRSSNLAKLAKLSRNNNSTNNLHSASTSSFQYRPSEATAMFASYEERQYYERSVNERKTFEIAPGITFDDYCPVLFRDLQSLYGLTEGGYLDSLGISQLQASMLCGTMTSLREMSSSSRSGSFFFQSHDNRFIIKTIPSGEMATFRRSLVNYYTHIRDRPDTLLTKVHGLHAIHFHPDKHKTIFIVMQNVFEPEKKIHSLYDLKGSTVQRNTPKEKRKKGNALKDLDFIQEERPPLLITKEIRTLLIEQVASDAAFLRKCGLIDYSILLAIHDSPDGRPIEDDVRPSKGGSRGSSRSPSPPGSPNSTAVHPLCSFYGGIKSSCGRRVFYLGIIDIMTDYSAIKVVEHYGKAIVYINSPGGVSCTSPEKYEERFVAFARTVFQEGTALTPERISFAASEHASKGSASLTPKRLPSPDLPYPDDEDDDEGLMMLPLSSSSASEASRASTPVATSGASPSRSVLTVCPAFAGFSVMTNDVYVDPVSLVEEASVLCREGGASLSPEARVGLHCGSSPSSRRSSLSAGKGAQQVAFDGSMSVSRRTAPMSSMRVHRASVSLSPTPRPPPPKKKNPKAKMQKARRTSTPDAVPLTGARRSMFGTPVSDGGDNIAFHRKSSQLSSTSSRSTSSPMTHSPPEGRRGRKQSVASASGHASEASGLTETVSRIFGEITRKTEERRRSRGHPGTGTVVNTGARANMNAKKMSLSSSSAGVPVSALKGTTTSTEQAASSPSSSKTNHSRDPFASQPSSPDILGSYVPSPFIRNGLLGFARKVEGKRRVSLAQMEEAKVKKQRKASLIPKSGGSPRGSSAGEGSAQHSPLSQSTRSPPGGPSREASEYTPPEYVKASLIHFAQRVTDKTRNTPTTLNSVDKITTLLSAVTDVEPQTPLQNSNTRRESQMSTYTENSLQSRPDSVQSDFVKNGVLRFAKKVETSRRDRTDDDVEKEMRQLARKHDSIDLSSSNMSETLGDAVASAMRSITSTSDAKSRQSPTRIEKELNNTFTMGNAIFNAFKTGSSSPPKKPKDRPSSRSGSEQSDAICDSVTQALRSLEATNSASLRESKGSPDQNPPQKTQPRDRSSSAIGLPQGPSMVVSSLSLGGGHSGFLGDSLRAKPLVRNGSSQGISPHASTYSASSGMIPTIKAVRTEEDVTALIAEEKERENGPGSAFSNPVSKFGGKLRGDVEEDVDRAVTLLRQMDEPLDETFTSGSGGSKISSGPRTFSPAEVRLDKTDKTDMQSLMRSVIKPIVSPNASTTGGKLVLSRPATPDDKRVPPRRASSSQPQWGDEGRQDTVPLSLRTDSNVSAISYSTVSSASRDEGNDLLVPTAALVKSPFNGHLPLNLARVFGKGPMSASHSSIGCNATVVKNSPRSGMDKKASADFALHGFKSSQTRSSSVEGDKHMSLATGSDYSSIVDTIQQSPRGIVAREKEVEEADELPDENFHSAGASEAGSRTTSPF